MIVAALPISAISAFANSVPNGYIGIYTVDDLYNVNNNLSGRYILMNNIDLTIDTALGGAYDFGGRGWTPIAGGDKYYADVEFSGIFDGNGYSISGMRIYLSTANMPSTISKSSHLDLGLFSSVSGTVKNLKIIDVSIVTEFGYGDSYSIGAGAITGQLLTGAKIENCYVDGEILVNAGDGYSYTGGLTGYSCGKVTSSCNLSNVSALTRVPSKVTYCGGVCGVNFGAVEDCYNAGIVSSRDSNGFVDTNPRDYACGICGYNNGDIKRTYNFTEFGGHSDSTGDRQAICVLGTDGTVENSYYLNGIADNSTSAKPLNEAQAQMQSMYVGFDFENVWYIDTINEYKYPQLRCFSVNLHEHSYGEWVIEIEPSCSSEGSKYKECSCGDRITETVERLAHVYGPWSVTQMATCENDGVKTRTCLNCSAIDTETLSASGHVYTTWRIDSEATCTENGLKHRTCVDCGNIETQVLEKYGHNYSSRYTIDEQSSCTKAGVKSRHCLNCEARTDVTVIEAKGHTYTNSFIVVKQPNGTEAGLMYKICLECEEKTGNIEYIETPSIAASNVSAGVQIKWSETAGAKEYKVYRSNGKDEATLITTTSSTSYTDKTVVSNETYTYYIEAVNGKIVSKSNIQIICHLSAPVLTVANQTSGTKVSWTAVEGATGYDVYRKTSTEGYKKVATVEGTSYVDKNVKTNIKYTYIVKATNESATSGYKTGKTILFLTAPTISKVENQSAGVKITWGKVSGTDSYEVYRKTASGNYVKIGTTTGTSYVDKTAKDNTAYTYMVKSVNGAYVSGYRTGKTILRLSAPVITLANTSSGVKISWGKIAGATSYEVYRKTGSGSYTKIATTTSTSYVDKTAKSGTKYTYMVKAVNGSYVSGYSGKTITCKK